MELLILKTRNTYIRVREEQYFEVRLDKASVFPMDQMNLVRTHETNLKNQGFESVQIKKLILSEKDL